MEKLIYARIQRMACMLLGNYHDGWDLTQDVMLELEKGRAKWQCAQSKRAWAMGVFHRQLKKFLRLEKKRRYAPLNTGDCGYESQLEKDLIAKEEVEKTFAAIGELDKRLAEALLLFSVEKLSVKDIAYIQGVAIGTVKWRIFEARRRLVKTVGKNFEKGGNDESGM